jgi:phage replication-related protein YjqB (UPF0714/DUF867 family)
MRRRLRVAGPNVAAARGAGSVVAGRGRSATMSPMDKKLAKNFLSFADLAAAYERDRDYRIVQRRCPGTSVAIVAPHGGSIEAHTSDIARDSAGQDFNLYLFEGLLKAGNFAALHLSSDRFDEPACLALLADRDQVVTVHGCGNAGEVVLMGGRDAGLREAIASRLRVLGLSCEDAPAGLDAMDPRNVCNRGRSGAGVQLELSLELRRSPRRALLIRAVREELRAECR